MKKDIFEDSTLINALMSIVEMYHLDVTREFILSALPVDPQKPKLFDKDPKNARSLFTRAAEKAGLKSSLEKKSLRKIPSEVLPCILLLEDDRSCVLLDFDKEMKYAQVLISGKIKHEGWISIEDLEQEYIGSLFMLKRVSSFDVEEKLEQMREETGSKHWFWNTLGRTKKIYFDILIGSFLINLFILALPLYLRIIYDRVIPNTAIDTMWVLTFAIITIFLLEAALKFLRNYFTEIAAKKSDVIMSSLIFERVLDMKMSEQTDSIGKFSSKLQQYGNIRNFLASSVVTTIIDIPFAIIFLVVIYWIAGDLVYIPIVTIALVILYALVMKDAIRKSIIDSNRASGLKEMILFESLNAIETMKAFNYSSVMQWKMEDAIGDIAQKSLKSRMLNGSIMTVTTFMIRIQTVAIIVGSVYMISIGELSGGGLLVAYILSSRAVSPVGKLVSLILQYNKAITGFKEIDKLMKMPVEHPKDKSFISPKHIEGKIEFIGVDFAYPEANQNVLRDISLKIEPGEHVAIMGKMGSGKSTLLNLLMGFYEPKQGMILIDYVEINQYSLSEYRNKIAYVPQEVILIQGSIKENIAIKHPGIDSHAIVEAAKTSGAINYINRNPDGFNMKIRERGQNISGGQRQSIGIARAFLEDTSIALLDEMTSDMDDESERIAIEGIRKKIAGKTTLIITHRNSLLSLVDRIIWMEDGKIVHDGKKEEVLQKLRNKGKKRVLVPKIRVTGNKS
jgi:ATP-binding cassette subfamily C protein LapB